VFQAVIPTLSENVMPFWQLILWTKSENREPDWEERLALEFLDSCMELNPQKRISAAEALEHSFLKCAEEDELVEDEVFLA
jgi:cell division control protein 7